MRFLNIFKKKQLSHKEKLLSAYDNLKSNKSIDFVFQCGINQAETIISSISKILNSDLSTLTSENYFNYLSMYLDVIYRKTYLKEMKSSIIIHLTFAYKIKDIEKAKRIFSFSSINYLDPYFTISSNKDFEELDSYYINNIYETSRQIIFNNQRINSDNYGYDKENPFCTVSISSSRSFLSKLLTEDGEKLFWLRKGSIFIPSYYGTPNVIIDEYQLFLNGEEYKKLYICPYALDSKVLPKGLKLCDSEDRSRDLSYEAKMRGITIEQLLEIHKIKPTNLYMKL